VSLGQGKGAKLNIEHFWKKQGFEISRSFDSTLRGI
jgi:hypothetical protein